MKRYLFALTLLVSTASLQADNSYRDYNQSRPAQRCDCGCEAPCHCGCTEGHPCHCQR